jgi:4-hydroxy-3-methylbut-2-enyl diphosphate reductase
MDFAMQSSAPSADAPAAPTLRVVRAEAMGLCFGVRDALTLTRQLARPEEVTIHGELVHNADVQAELSARGFHQSPEGAREVLPRTPRVLITAHGISERERTRLELAGKELVDTTCPLVRRVHDAARRLACAGCHVLVAGKRGHVEVRGIVEDLASCDVIEHAGEVRAYPHERLGLVSQTTMPERELGAIHAAVVAKNPRADLRLVDTVCAPTKERQTALERLLDQVELLVVVGGANSNNTARLAERGRARGVPSHHVTGPAELDPAWLRGVTSVGLTAGTSTPDERIDAVEARLRALAAR